MYEYSSVKYAIDPPIVRDPMWGAGDAAGNLVYNARSIFIGCCTGR
jgi:hypothetical protein